MYRKHSPLRQKALGPDFFFCHRNPRRAGIMDPELKSAFDLRERRYKLLRDQYQRAKEQQKTYKIWRIVDDGKTRPEHDAIDGTVIPIDDDFSVGGERLFLPSDPSASLTQTANCRCTVEFVSQTENGTPLSAHGEGRDTIIVYEDGTEEVRSGGTRSWRNNNPGNLRNSPFSIRHGSLGEAGGFAVFPSEDAGWRALLSLLRGPTFQGLTLDRMIARYAPPDENDTPAYRDFIENRLGVSEETRLSELSSSQIEELASIIRRFEGWSVGTVRRRKGE